MGLHSQLLVFTPCSTALIHLHCHLQALVGQMYAEGYGCELNLQAAKHWTDKARERGFKMQGVYDEL